MNWESIKKEIRRKPPTKVAGGADQELEDAMSEDQRNLVEDTRKSTIEAIVKILRDMGEDEIADLLQERLKME